MKTASPDFTNALKLEVAGLVRLWSIITKDGAEFYFTDADVNITWNDTDFISSEGFIASATVQEIGQGQQGLNISFALSETGITKKKIDQGDFDSASVSLNVYNTMAPTAGTFLLFKGRVNTTDIDNIGNASFDVVGLIQSGQSSLNMEQYSLTCRADFGDERCKYDYLSTAVAFTILTVTNKQEFTSPQVNQPDNTFSLGFIEFLTGNNAGLYIEVMYNSAGKVVLYLPTPAPMQPGDTGKIYKGCDKTIATCNSYGNIFNFRGEPFDPLATIVEPAAPAPPIPAATTISGTPVEPENDKKTVYQFPKMNVSG